MFWNDPNLYGATFGFKDIPQQLPMQTPYLGTIPPWQAAWQQNVPRFLPPTMAYNVPFAPPAFTPFNVPAPFFAQHLTPYNLPYFNWIRPLPF